MDTRKSILTNSWLIGRKVFLRSLISLKKSKMLKKPDKISKTTKMFTFQTMNSLFVPLAL